jgi:hypothetical protein
LFDSFDTHRKKGLVPLPSTNERTRDSHGAHADGLDSGEEDFVSQLVQVWQVSTE